MRSTNLGATQGTSANIIFTWWADFRHPLVHIGYWQGMSKADNPARLTAQAQPPYGLKSVGRREYGTVMRNYCLKEKRF
ncbi:hypothetical protein ACPV3A_26235 [Paenibacillus sp. Dod16]|uniref:hypothetical protein n=1 Tax=Paenibacillus sp. Dod16 TaxID=3416392 RepID=UPI003CF530E4